ncbi:hypothetical protein RI129_010958 [Pyrocoelia pectoralis]|uniref:Uncharacterized protein n=1 Tax=Pyrocoelia pectoralis TaxID=417401 RepID=A0AAN7ZEV5_9COLE
MSRFELEFACLIPKSKPEEEPSESPFITYKGTEYKKTLRFNFPSWKPIKSRLKRFWNWLGFVWFHSRSRKCRKICFLFVLSILLLLFTIICVFIPLLFKYSSSFRQYVIFSPVIASHDSFNEAIELYKHYDSKIFVRPDNLYVKINGTRDKLLGVWDLPQYGNGSSPKYYTKAEYLKGHNTNNYLLFFHDSYGNRRSYTTDYSKLLHFFNIIVFDYRAYGDSFVDDLNEKGLVYDGVQLFKWVQSHVNGSIFLWGDSLGSAIAAHTAAALNINNLHPCGVMLENPFTSMAEQLGYSWFIAKMNWYMPWYKSTIGDSLVDDDLSFNTNKYINEIDCPIGFLEWNRHRAKQFNRNITIYDYYDGNSPPPFTNAITELQKYFYYKTDTQIHSDMERFLRSFINAGRRYCDAKMLQ